MSDGFPVASDIHTLIFDFDGVFTDNKVWVGLNGSEWVRCDRADGLAMDILRSAGRRGRVEADVFILSTETNPVVRERAEKLRIARHQGDNLISTTRMKPVPEPGQQLRNTQIRHPFRWGRYHRPRSRASATRERLTSSRTSPGLRQYCSENLLTASTTASLDHQAPTSLQILDTWLAADSGL